MYGENTLSARLGELNETLGNLDPGCLSVGELDVSIRTLTGLAERLEAARLAVVSEFDRRNGAAVTAHTSTTAYLKDACDMAGPTAREKVRVARMLGEFEVTAQAYKSGDVAYSNLRQLSTAASAHPDVYRDHEEVLVDAAASLSVKDLGALLAHWRQALDGPGALQESEAMHERRRAHVSETFEGMVRMDADLDPATAEPIRVALDAISDRDARASTPDHPDTRTNSQRTADALSEICRQWIDLADTPQSGGEKPHITVMMDIESLIGTDFGWAETPYGRAVHPEECRRYACDAAITRLLFTGETQPLDIGRQTRIVPAGLRRAVTARDRTCRFPGCDRPPRWGDIHHIIHWLHGGRTEILNLILLCRRHHRLVHEGGWKIQGTGADPLFISPSGQTRQPNPDPRDHLRKLKVEIDA